jgi:hypothetical protein
MPFRPDVPAAETTLYVMCWKPADRHWRSWWLVGPFDDLTIAERWATDYVEDQQAWITCEWNGDLAHIKVLSPNPLGWLL